MTVFGTDISSFQHGLDLSRLAEASFVIAKTTEGTYYTDADYQGWRQQAARLGKLFTWYHFLSGEDVHAQAAHCLANVGDKSLPGMLDVEPAGNYTPTLAQALAFVDAAHAAGLNLRLMYLPRWVWQQMGSPDLSGLTARGVYLVSSAYPGGTGSPSHLYPGDAAAGWGGYGGLTPLLYQFTNQASDGGQPLDYNAFRGSVQQLAAYLKTTTPASATGGTDVILTPEDIAAVAKAVNEYSEAPVTINGKPFNATLFDLAHGAWYALNDPSGAVPQIRSQVNDLHKQPTPLTAAAITAAVQTAVQNAISAGLVTEQAGAQIAQQVVEHLTLTVGAK
jgi:hypothetical protein